MNEKKNIIGINGRTKFFLFLFIVFVLIICISLLRNYELQIPDFIIIFNHMNSSITPILFIISYVIMSMLFLPTLPLNILAGVLWGALLGGIYSLVALSISTTITFFLTRYLAHEYIQRYFTHKYWKWIMNNVNESGWKIVAFTRVNPIFPTSLLNYFYGLTSIKYSHYILASVIFLLPLVLAFSYLGSSIGNAVVNDEVNNIIYNLMKFSGIVVFIAIINLFIKKWLSADIKSVE